MQPQDQKFPFNRNGIIAALAVIAMILFVIGFAVFNNIRNRLNAKMTVGGANSAKTATEVALPTWTLDQNAQSSNKAATQEPPASSPISTATSSPPAFQTPNRPSVYVLQKGEWPICIARRYNLEMKSFLALNNLTMKSSTAVGTKLKIPASGFWNPANGPRSLLKHPAKYTIKANDTLYRIACQYGDVYPEEILYANSMSSADELKVGKSITIP